MLVRGAAIWFGGFVDEGYLLTKAIYPKWVEDKMQPECSSKVCDAFYFYVGVFLTILSVRAKMNKKLEKFDLKKRFNEAALEA